VNPDLAQRLLVLAGAGLVALVAALAVLELRDAREDVDEPDSVAAPGGGWYTALAGRYAPSRRERRTECGYRRRVAGVSHPVLPCGVKLTLRVRGRVVLTQVVDRDPGARNREFGITRALARRIGFGATVERIRWRFAAG
jgi:hypothetical protein